MQLLRVTPKDAATIAAEAAKADQPDVEPVPAESGRTYADAAVDVGMLSQLLLSAQQSGMVPAAEQIAEVRDREFRAGRHQAALDVIERLYIRFSQEMSQRQQRLRTEEMDYRSGKLTMTPKEWQAKKQRDMRQTQLIDQARRDFSRVLGGLRLLISSK